MRKLLGVVCLIVMLAGAGLAAESAVDAPDAVRGTDQSAVARTIRLTPSAGRGDHLFLEGAEISLAANVPEIGSENESIRVVTYLANDRPVARSMKSPYVAVWKPRPGTYTLRARARYKDGSESLSEPMTVMVAKRWGYPDWVRWRAVSPYSDEDESDQGKDESNCPPPEDVVIDGVSSIPKLTILPVDLPDSYAEQRSTSIAFTGGFSAYKVIGDIPDEVARLSLPVVATHQYRIEHISVIRHDGETEEWSVLPTDIHLDDKLYAVATARISKTGIYTTGVLQTRTPDYKTALAKVGVDTESPEITWMLPAKGAIISGETELLVAADDNVDVRSVHFYIEGCLGRTMLLGRDWTAMDGGWKIEIDFSKWVSGQYTLHAVAYDMANNESTAVREIVIDTDAVAPQVTVDMPHYDQELGYIVVEGKTSHPDGKIMLWPEPEEGRKAYAGIPADVSKDGTWSGGLPDMLPGANNTLTVEAWDKYLSIGLAQIQYSVPLYKVVLIRLPKSEYEGTAIKLFAQAWGGSGPTEYKYEVSDGTGWTLLRDYQVEPNWYNGDGAEPHCIWTTGPPGKYTIRVTARDEGTSDPVVSDECQYTVAEPLSGVSLSADPTSPQQTGVKILLTATPIGGLDARFEFEVFDGQEWSPLDWEEEWSEECHYSNQRFFAPDTPGTYTIKVTVREENTTSPVFTDEMTYVITSE